MKRPLIGWVIVMALLCAASGVQAKSLKLAYKFTKGQTDKYKMIIDANLALTGVPGVPDTPMDCKITGVMTQKVLDVSADGNARIRVSYSEIKMTSKALSEASKTSIPSAPTIMSVARDGRVLAIEGSGEEDKAALHGVHASQLAGPMGYYGMFPAESINVGQSWTISHPIPAECGAIEVDSVLMAAALPYGNDTAAKIRQTYNCCLDIESMLSSMAAVACDTEITRRLKSSGIGGWVKANGWNVMYFSPAKGKLLKSNGTIKAEVVFEMADPTGQQGRPLQMAIDINAKIDVVRI